MSHIISPLLSHKWEKFVQPRLNHIAHAARQQMTLYLFLPGTTNFYIKLCETLLYNYTINFKELSRAPSNARLSQLMSCRFAGHLCFSRPIAPWRSHNTLHLQIIQWIMGSPGGNWPRKTKGVCEPATHPLHTSLQTEWKVGKIRDWSMSNRPFR
jgi:hypothetical protein